MEVTEVAGEGEMERDLWAVEALASCLLEQAVEQVQALSSL